MIQLLLVAATLAAHGAVVAHPFTAKDMQSMDRLSEPQLSPNGKWVAFTVRSTDFDANKGRHSLWLAAMDGSNVRPITRGESDLNGRWMPDGKSLLFLSTRSGSSQVWQLPLDGGEAVQLTRFPVDVDAFAIFPDGKRLLLAMRVYAELPPNSALDESAKRDKAATDGKVRARTYDSLPVRHWDTWEDHKRNHLFTWSMDGAAPLDLMPGFNGDCPTKPFGDETDFAISPDGKDVIFAAQVSSADAAWSTDVNLFAVPSSGGGKPRVLTADNKASDQQPIFSPDGRTVAYLARQRPGYESDRRRIVLLDRASGKKRVLTEGWDRSPDEMKWTADGKALLVSAENVGHQSLFSVDASTGAPTLLVEKGTNGSASITGSRLVYLHDSLDAPAELFTASLDGSGAKPLTALNAQKLDQVQRGAYEQFVFSGAKNESVHGFLMKPVGFKPGRKYPVAVIIHGGPEGSIGDHFHYRWNPQNFAGAGYAVVMIDFHGSTGYGQAFTDAIRMDWGGAPMEDLMKGVDFALAQYPFLDSSRMAALGASYGGYMINWLEGHTDRFKCVVNHDGIFDTRATYYETEELWFPEWEFGGTPWEHPEAYEKNNPAQFVKNWVTPMLVVQGGLDYRIAESQGLATFSALQRRGVPSKLLDYPDENHWVLKPQNSLLWHQTVIGWLDQWTQPSTAKAALKR